MSDAQHPDLTPSDWDVADRDARIEQLLLAGLDHYFAARYDQAINVWTRVLFLDRGHARARAYIERARSAQAERQRESLELLHHGVDAFDRGDTSAARQLLSSAVEQGAPQEEALALLGRLDRLEVASGPAQPSPEPPSPRRVRRTDATGAGERPSGSLLVPFVLLAAATLVVAGGLSALSAWDRMPRWLPFADAGPAAVTTVAPPSPLVIPPASEAALARARSLVAERPLGPRAVLGDEDARALREALRVLDSVKPGDALRADVDALRVDIERALLSGVEPAEPSPPPVRPGGLR
jgi:hypothetical protein